MPTIRVAEFDILRPGYGGAEVSVYLAGTTTLADLWLDEDKTEAADNPQVLQSIEVSGVLYGKFLAPVYTDQSYSLDIANHDQTGVIRIPLTTLVGEDASQANATPTGGVPGTLADILARRLDALNFGSIGNSAATNNATIVAAAGAAAAMGGGVVMLPSGTIPFTSITLAAGVMLEGRGRGATVLQCQTAGNCLTLGGDRSGLRRLTLDGLNLVASSVGVYAQARNETVLDDVEIKRFATGLHCKGGSRSAWRELYLSGSATNAKLHGDGAAWEFNSWVGGLCELATTVGVDLSYEDARAWNNTIQDVGFVTNLLTAVRINGARYTEFPGCWWSGNGTALVVQDDDNASATARASNTVVGVRFEGGRLSGGAATIRDTAQDIVFERCLFDDIDIALTQPSNSIITLDCVETATVALTGTGTRWVRQYTEDCGSTSIITSDGTATKSWAVELLPGQLVYAEAKVLGNQRNGANTGEYHFSVSAKRAGATLAYDAQTTNFVLGGIVLGGTSGATGLIIADSDSGTSGTLTLRDISGAFIDNEPLTGSTGGAATCAGTLSNPSVSILGSVLRIRDREDVSGWTATFAANGPELEVQVTGAASTDIEWTSWVQVTST